MHPAPYPNPDETATKEDKLVADPIATETEILWISTAKRNREIFTEIFRPIPTNLIRGWGAYDVGLLLFLPFLLVDYCCWQNYRSKGKTGHVVPDIPLERVKTRLHEVRGSLVECPLVCLRCYSEYTRQAVESDIQCLF